MRDGWREEPEVEGGCQCGAVRFRLAAGPAKSTVCHCRMCQRACSNAFAPLFEVMNSAVTWAGKPTTWASSNLVERGFCAACGTPIFYRGLARDTTEFLAGTLSPAFAYRPIANHGVESRRAWLSTLNNLPDRETFLPEDETLVSHQSPEASGAATHGSEIFQ